MKASTADLVATVAAVLVLVPCLVLGAWALVVGMFNVPEAAIHAANVSILIGCVLFHIAYRSER